jgi:hypothetical protein
MAGVTTDVCLVYPAISARREGFQVQAVMDASGSPYEISEDMSLRRMEWEGVVLTATNTLMAELAQDWSRPEGGQLLGITFSRRTSTNRLTRRSTGGNSAALHCRR